MGRGASAGASEAILYGNAGPRGEEHPWIALKRASLAREEEHLRMTRAQLKEKDAQIEHDEKNDKMSDEWVEFLRESRERTAEELARSEARVADATQGLAVTIKEYGGGNVTE